MKFVTDEETLKEYKEFLIKHERCNFQQSPEWAKVKSNWKHEVVLAEAEDGKIIGILSILIRKIPIFGNIMYSSRGPICDIHDLQVLNQLTEGAKELAKKYKAIVFKMEPDIESSDKEFRKSVENLGYKIKDKAKNFREVIQSRYVFRLNIKNKTEDEVFAGFHQKTRYNVRLAIKKGVVVKEGKKEDLKEFYKIMSETGNRDGFIIRSLSYFEKMYDELAPEYMKIFMAYYEGKAIAGVIPVWYGNKTWYLYGASSNEHRNLMPNYLLQWEMIKLAIQKKCEIYDLRGVSGTIDKKHPQYGLYRFKKGFGGDFLEFIGEVYIPFKPVIYSIYRVSEKVFRNLRGLIAKLKR